METMTNQELKYFKIKTDKVVKQIKPFTVTEKNVTQVFTKLKKKAKKLWK